MALKLRVISDQYRELGKRSSRLFGVSGGRIGRSADNDWVLPDPDRYISSHHAKILYSGGDWMLEDTSTNGVFVNGADTPISVNGSYALKDGDRLRLGDYDLLVSIDARTDFPPDASGQIPMPPSRPGASAGPPAARRSGEDLGEALDLAVLLGDGMPSPNAPNPVPSARGATGASPVKLARRGHISLLAGEADEGEQRTVVHSKASAPPEWAMATRPLHRVPPIAGKAAPAPEPERLRRGDGAGELHAGVEAFCRGAGLDPASLATDTQATLLALAGQMMREMVLGVMEALKSRADVKHRFRISQTTIQPAENNPLKFSPGVDEAMRKLLDGHGNRYLGPIDAVREAFIDLRLHQHAVGSATQQALDELLQRLAPGQLQERFDRGLKRGALLGATNKMKYWDLYTEFYNVVNQRDEEGLPAAFAEDFARMYDDKVGGDKKSGKRR
jgi:type VI secretion system FHA domain protein